MLHFGTEARRRPAVLLVEVSIGVQMFCCVMLSVGLKDETGLSMSNCQEAALKAENKASCSLNKAHSANSQPNP